MKTAVVSGKPSKKSKRRSFRPIVRPKNPRPEETTTATLTRTEASNNASLVNELPNNNVAKVVEQATELSTALVEHSGTVTTPALDEEIPDGDKKLPAVSTNSLPLELVPPVIPENSTGKPALKSFCTFPRRKRTKKANETAVQPSQAVVAAQEEVDAAPELAAPAGPAVQIINGELVLQESSMICHNTTGKNLQNTAMTVVEEEAETAIVNATYTSFATGRRARAQTAQWNPEETQLFYQALRQVGLDFSCMESYFAASTVANIRKRDRRQLKRKYQRESATNPKLVEQALLPSKRVKIDLSVFELTKQAVLEYQQTKEGEKVDDDEGEATDPSGAAASATNAAQSQSAATAPVNPSTNVENTRPAPSATTPVASETAVEHETDPILLDDDHAATKEGETTLSLGVALAKKKKATKTKRPRVHRPRKTRPKSKK